MIFQKSSVRIVLAVTAAFGFAACSPQSNGNSAPVSSINSSQKEVIQTSSITVSQLRGRVTNSEVSEFAKVKKAVVSKEVVAVEGEMGYRTTVEFMDETGVVAVVHGDEAMENFEMASGFSARTVEARTSNGRITSMVIEGDGSGAVLTFGDDDGSQDDGSQDNGSQDDGTQDDPKQDEPKQDEPKQDEPKQDEPKQEDPKQEDPNQDDDGSQDDGGQDDGGQDDGTPDDDTADEGDQGTPEA